MVRKHPVSSSSAPTLSGLSISRTALGRVAVLGNLNAAASRLGFYSVQGLQNAIHTLRGG